MPTPILPVAEIKEPDKVMFDPDTSIQESSQLPEAQKIPQWCIFPKCNTVSSEVATKEPLNSTGPLPKVQEESSPFADETISTPPAIFKGDAPSSVPAICTVLPESTIPSAEPDMIKKSSPFSLYST